MRSPNLQQIRRKLLKKHRNYFIHIPPPPPPPPMARLRKRSRFLFFFSELFVAKPHFFRPLWIDSLYGSNNSNLPSMYDDSYGRLHRASAAAAAAATVTTTNEYPVDVLMPSTSRTYSLVRQSTQSIKELDEYARPNVLLPEVKPDEICLSETKQSKQTNDKLNQIRRIRSDANLLLVNEETFDTSDAQSPTSIKRSKSLSENLHRIPSEKPPTSEAKPDPQKVDLPIDDWRPILQILENVFADEEEQEEEKVPMVSRQPESLEPLLPKTPSCYNDRHHHSAKSIERRSENDTETSTSGRFRRSASNQGGRRRRLARRATCKSFESRREEEDPVLIVTSLSAVDQRQSSANDERSSQRQPSPSISSLSYRPTTTTLKSNDRPINLKRGSSLFDCLALHDETNLHDDSLTTTPSDESSQLISRTTDRPRWIPVYQSK